MKTSSRGQAAVSWVKRPSPRWAPKEEDAPIPDTRPGGDEPFTSTLTDDTRLRARLHVPTGYPPQWTAARQRGPEGYSVGGGGGLASLFLRSMSHINPGTPFGDFGRSGRYRPERLSLTA
jgi:hypothetical protein